MFSRFLMNKGRQNYLWNHWTVTEKLFFPLLMTIINLKILSLNRIEVKNAGFLEKCSTEKTFLLVLQLYRFHAFTFLMCPSATTITTVISSLIISSKTAQSRKIVIRCLFFFLSGIFQDHVVDRHSSGIPSSYYGYYCCVLGDQKTKAFFQVGNVIGFIVLLVQKKLKQVHMVTWFDVDGPHMTVSTGSISSSCC